MPNCISINGLEHLANEQTLLIHYNILCTGTWYLSQLLTAYRNVCDTEWTVMYPNHQHPRHSDFPIVVDNPGLGATFAWNYGGIQGISSENFDAYHSYLVQLTIFNYNCFNTGETGSTGTGGSEPTGTGTSGETNTGIGGFGGGGGGRGPGPGGGGGGNPGVTVYIIPEWRPPGGGGGSTVTPIEPLPPGGGGGPGGVYLPIPVEPLPPGGGGGPGGWLPMPLPPGEPGGGGGGAGGGGILVEPLPLPPNIPNGGIGIIPIDPREPNPPGGGGGGGGVYLPFPVEPLPPGGGTNPGGITPTLIIVEPNPPIIKPIPGGIIVEEPVAPNYSEPEPGIIIEPGIISAGNPPNSTDPGTIGIATPEPGNTTVVTNSTPLVTSYYSAERPNQVPPGGTLNPFLQLTRIGEPNTNALPGTNIIDLTSIEASSQGAPVNSLAGNVIVTNANSSSVTSKIPFSQIEYNSTIDIQCLTSEIFFGRPIVLSCFFRPITALRAKLVLSIQDTSRSFDVTSTPFIDANQNTPITCGGSFVSTVFNLGNVTAIVKAINENNQIIAAKSIQLVLLQPDNSGLNQYSAFTRDRDLPTLLLNTPASPLANNPVYISLPSNSSKYIIYKSNTTKSTISAVLKTRYNTEDRYSITILGEVGGKSLSPGKTINIKELGYSNKKITINEEQVYLDYHNVGIKDIPTQGATTFVIELAPTTENIEGQSEGWLYVSEGFAVRPASAVVTSSTITATLPLAAHKYGLVINGKQKNSVPSNYVIKESTSTIQGITTWTSLALTKGDYFSIIESVNDVLNPFSTPIYQGQFN